MTATYNNNAVVWYKVEVTNRRKDIDTGQDFVRVSGYVKHDQFMDSEDILRMMSTERLLLRSELDTMSDAIVYRYMDGDVVEVQKVAIKKEIEGVRGV